MSINDAGRRQAEALARRLAPVTFDRVFTSPLFRARETASLLVRNVAIEADPRLREMDYGAWEGRTYEQIAETDGAFRRQWEAEPDTLACPGGESGQRRRRPRSARSSGDLLDEHRSWHAKASFRAATSGWGSATPRDRAADARRRARHDQPDPDLRRARRSRSASSAGASTQDQANLTVLRWDLDAAPDEARMLVLNDTAHLRRADEAPWS